MGRPRIGMTGKRFGRLTGVRLDHISDNGDAFWLFRCDCGSDKVIYGSHVRHGVAMSCGCLQKQLLADRTRTHGMSRTLEHNAWCRMKGRCYNGKTPNFRDYGGRGITVCDEWLEAFEQFYADMGPIPSQEFSIERKNNDLGYFKDNCVWGTDTDQSRNRRSVKLSLSLALEAKALRSAGVNMAQWARLHGLNRSTVHSAAIGKTWKES